MPTIKYFCPKCGKKFVEWGAKKFNFKCPNCHDVQLERIGISGDQIISTPKIRRKPRLIEEEGDIEFPESYSQEEELEDFGVPDVPIIEDEEPSLEEELPPDEVVNESGVLDDTISPEEELGIEEEE
ncbi:MAG TPA: hypothetical protein PLX23_08335 [Candidatus Hydrogenedens sp.]|nr:hypothetical protein [Candidatus Hydrogenedens sp.]